MPKLPAQSRRLGVLGSCPQRHSCVQAVHRLVDEAGGLSPAAGRVEHMFEDVVEVRDRLAVLVDRLDPDAVSGSTARELWQVFDAAERLCAAGKTLLARRVAQTHQRDRDGTRSAAEELARKAGTSAGAAKEAMDTSTRLPGQPELDTALRRGELSPAQAGLISAAAAADPAEERRLTELARAGVAGRVAGRVRPGLGRRRDPDPEATSRRLHAGRRLRRWTGLGRVLEPPRQRHRTGRGGVQHRCWIRSSTGSFTGRPGAGPARTPRRLRLRRPDPPGRPRHRTLRHLPGRRRR